MKCPECNADIKEITKNIEDKKLTEMICPECGLVVSEILIHSGCGGKIEAHFEDSMDCQTCQKCHKEWKYPIDID